MSSRSLLTSVRPSRLLLATQFSIDIMFISEYEMLLVLLLLSRAQIRTSLEPITIQVC